MKRSSGHTCFPFLMGSPWASYAHAVMHVGIPNPRGKRSRHSRRMRILRFLRKRPINTTSYRVIVFSNGQVYCDVMVYFFVLVEKLVLNESYTNRMFGKSAKMQHIYNYCYVDILVFQSCFTRKIYFKCSTFHIAIKCIRWWIDFLFLPC